MGTINITKTYQDGTVLYDTQLDDMFDSIEQFVNVEKLDGDNIQPLAVTTAKISDQAVTTAKIADGAIVTTRISDAAVTTAKISDGAITTALISDATIKKSQVSYPTYQESAVINFSTTSDAEQTAGSVNITTTGGAVLVMLQQAVGSPGVSFIRAHGGSTGIKSVVFRIYRDGIMLAGYPLCTQHNSSPGEVHAAPASIRVLDDPPAGAHTYEIRTYHDDVYLGAYGSTKEITNCKLVAKELVR